MDSLRRTTARNRLKLRLGENRGISKNLDLLIYLDFVMFLERLEKAAEKQARKKGKDTITYPDVRDNLEDVLREFRG